MMNLSMTMQIWNLSKLIQNTQSKMMDSWKERTQIEDIKSKQLALTNGTVGKSYEFIFDFTEHKFSEIGDYYVEIDESIGLKFEKNQIKYLVC
ncbi:MAG: hypothetical protein IPK08_11965 [Bacteroidetes bacterium]|nr:hypothetical protein [Bacteroidota bacterium]